MNRSMINRLKALKKNTMSCRFLANLYLCSTEIKPPFHGRDNKTQLNNDSLNLFYLVFRFQRLIVIYPESNAWFGTHVNL